MIDQEDVLEEVHDVAVYDSVVLGSAVYAGSS
jgi:hypothetical protein